ncbi:MAG: DUF4301 family protein [Paludibacteraceae bacterium]|nr:DUF4301 family protein [Paludibacteraceae bacterium]
MDKDDVKILEQKGISPEQFQAQIDSFKNGFPFLVVEKPAVVGDGILSVCDADKEKYISKWRTYLLTHDVVKFTPASGAASRMFKNLFEFKNRGGEPQTDFERKFIEELTKFAFYDELNKKCQKNEGKTVLRLISEKKFDCILENLLGEKGLNYQFLPKGLLLFHKTKEGPRTPFEEHLVEGALYAKANSGKVKLHYTVSEEHMEYFEALKKKKLPDYEYNFGTEYNISFSVQSHSTDTVAVDSNNEPFRDKDGKIVFRPGGHGALIQNLNKIDSDVIFIKNIDNVVPDALKQPTVEYKAILAGILVSYQEKIFGYLSKLRKGSISNDDLKEIDDFVQNILKVKPAGSTLYISNRVEFLKSKLNRPLRVCGMVKNEGEPGGGPFFAHNDDGSISLQILESAQFDPSNESQMKILSQSTHFNPVDLVCAVKDIDGKKFDLTKYVDYNTGFISSKSKDGRELKALELPGLWNGAMSDWNTIFVEVPVDTFNPVKTVNDLLRKEHQV